MRSALANAPLLRGAVGAWLGILKFSLLVATMSM